MTSYKYILVFLLFVSPVMAVDTVITYQADLATDIYSQQATTNFGSATSMTLNAKSAPAARDRRVLVHMDPTGVAIPTGDTVLEVCSMFVWATASINNKTISFHRILKDWVENEVTWNIWSTGNDWSTSGGKDFPTGDTCCDNSEDGSGADIQLIAMDQRTSSVDWADTWVGFEVDSALSIRWLEEDITGNAGVVLWMNAQSINVSIPFHSDDNDSVPFFNYYWTVPLAIGNIAFRHRDDTTDYKHRDSDGVSPNYYRHQP